MSNSAREIAATRAEMPTLQRPGGISRKTVVALITADEALWARVGAAVSGRCQLKQFDSIAAAMQDDSPNSASVFMWDARGQANIAADMARLQRHAESRTLVAIDEAAASARWKVHIRSDLLSGLIDETASHAQVADTVLRAMEESQARALLLIGPDHEVSPEPASGNGGTPRRLMGRLAITAAVAILAFTAVYALRSHNINPGAGAAVPVQPRKSMPLPQSAEPVSADAQMVEQLLEQARQAMLERRYAAPADPNALTLYRRILSLDAHNGEANQGVDRLTGLLLDRAEAALQARQFDQGLQAIEAARSLRPGDERLTALDARMIELRNDLGPRQIQTAILAQNFDHAAQLIDEGVNSKALTAAQAVSLRELLQHQRLDVQTDKYINLAQLRMQQNRLLDPANDSAITYWSRARQSGSRANVTGLTRELALRLVDAAYIAVQQRKFTDADRLIAAAKQASAPVMLLQSVQRGLVESRAQSAREAAVQSAAAETLRAEQTPKAIAKKEAPEPPLVLVVPMQPVYPKQADKDGVEGWVDVAFTVKSDGKTADIRVAGSSPRRIFDDAAVDAVRRARYKPLSLSDTGVARRARVRLSFRQTP